MQTTKINAARQFTTTDNVDFNAKKIINLADPTLDQDAATKQYVDSVAVGLSILQACRVATTVAGGNITLSGTQTIDGVALSVGNRVLVKNQTSGIENGIYVVQAGAWSRSTDADEDAEVKTGMFTFISEGISQQGTGWVLSTPAPIEVGVTSLTFTQFSGAATYSAGDGLALTGSVFSVKTVSSARITVASGGIDLALSGVTSGTYGSATETDYKVPRFAVDTYGRLTSAGELAWFASITANYVFAGPASGSAVKAAFRALVFQDMIPGLATGATTSTVTANGQLLIGNGAKFTLQNITGSTGLSVTNGSGTITLANTGVTGITGTANQIAVTASTGQVTISFPTTGVTIPQKTILGAATTSYASLNIPTGVTPTSPNVGDIWLIQATGILARYGGTAATHTIADLDSLQTFTANKTLTNPTLATIAAGTTEVAALLLKGDGKMVTRTLGSNAFSDVGFVQSVTGTANRIIITGTSVDPIINIDTNYVGQSSITTVSSTTGITTGVWKATVIQKDYGGTGHSSYTNGQLLIGNSTGNTLDKAVLTQGTNITITNGAGQITIQAANAVDITKFIFGEVIIILGGEGSGACALQATPVVDKEAIFVNGIFQKRGADYTISGASITFQAGAIPHSTDNITAIYIQA